MNNIFTTLTLMGLNLIPYIILRIIGPMYIKKFLLEAKKIGLRKRDINLRDLFEYDNFIFVPIFNFLLLYCYFDTWKRYCSTDFLKTTKDNLILRRLSLFKKYNNDKEFNSKIDNLLKDNSYKYSEIINSTFMSLTDIIVDYEENRDKIFYKVNKREILKDLHVSIDDFKKLTNELIDNLEDYKSDMLGFSAYSKFINEILLDVKDKKAIFV